ncbi:PA14 domain-containing protein [Akkermansiaceae bacterium]|nr:PA14 domain-containing protein [Akkermansiaceae bacterium]MDB4544527.1 PA14 domain-containing protein [Akkermansiaceae bacterium]
MKQLLAFTLLTSSALAAEDGKANYTLYCSACHAPDGKGINNGQFPALAGSEWVKGKPDRMIQAVLHGLQGPIYAAGKEYNLVMPPQGAALTDAQLSSIITYVRSSWSHKESAVSTSQIKAAREVSKDRTQMWESSELLEKYPIPNYKGAVAEAGPGNKKGKIQDLLSYIHHGDFGSLKELRASKAQNAEEEKDGLISLKHADRKEKFGLVWEGWLDAPAAGKYTFIYDTDDGGAITINGKEIITRDRVGPAGKPTKKSVKLKKGRNDIKIEYFEKAGQEEVSLSWNGPGISNQSLSDTRSKQQSKNPSIPLTPPVNEATIYRNFIAGTDARGIGVGYFENVNLAFSGDSMSVDMLWTGKFMDAGRHWTGRGQGFQGPAGENVVTVNRGIPFAILESQTTAWPQGPDPALAPLFKGYKLDKKQQPTFLYQFGNVRVSDTSLPAQSGQGFSRTLTLDVPAGSASDKVLYFRALSGNQVQANGERSFSFDKLAVAVPTSAYAPFARENELLIPVPLTAGTHKIQLNYSWK